MKKPLLAAIALVLLGVSAYWWYSPGQVLKRRTVVLLETLSMPPGSGKASRQMGLYTISAMLAPDVVLVSPSIDQANGEFPRQELESAFSALCEYSKECRFENPQFQSIDASGGEADVVFTVRAMVELGRSRPVDGTYRVNLHWRNPEGNWLLTRAQWDLAK
jgi:ketosteroid isomerase-like protein